MGDLLPGGASPQPMDFFYLKGEAKNYGRSGDQRLRLQAAALRPLFTRGAVLKFMVLRVIRLNRGDSSGRVRGGWPA